MKTPARVKILVLAALSLLAASHGSAQTSWYVDDDAPGDPGPGDPLVSDPLEDGTADHPFDAIQEGINAATNGDIVLVLDGTYAGVGNRDMDFGGRLITVRSESGPETCMIDLQDAAGSRAFVFQSGETAEAVVDGFTITGGWSASGPGVAIWSGAPTVGHCVFSGNFGFHGGGGAIVSAPGYPPTRFAHCTFMENSGAGASCGGGLLIELGSAVLVDCEFVGNSANNGGGLCLRDGTARLAHCAFVGNTAVGYGGAIDVGWNASALPSVTNCAFVENVAGLAGGGIAAWDQTAGGLLYIFVRNSTFAGNEADTGRSLAANTFYVDYCVYNSILWEVDPVHCSGGAGFHPYYSNVQGFDGGAWPGNIDADPLFVDPPSGDYRLGPGSPCIDAANITALPPDTYDLDNDGDTTEPIPVDLDWLPRIVDDPNTIDTGVGFPCVDMGAYELQPAGSGVEVSADQGRPTRIWSAAPNPLRSTATVRYSVAAGEVATLEVFDVVGRRVATLADATERPGGIRQSTWNGLNADGGPAASGVYLIRLRTWHGTDSRVIVLLR